MDEVRRLRKLRGLSQVELAELAGVSAFTVTEIETGRREPRPSTLRKLADALGVSVADFFTEEAIPPKAPPPLQFETPGRDLAQRRRLFKAQTAMHRGEARELQRLAAGITNKGQAKVIARAGQSILNDLEGIGALEELRTLVHGLEEAEITADDLLPEDVAFRHMVSEVVAATRRAVEFDGGHGSLVIDMDAYRSLSA